MIKRLLATTAVLVGAGAMPVALGAGHASAATIPLVGPAQPVSTPVQPVLGTVSTVIAPAPAPAPPAESASGPAAPPAATSPPPAAASAPAPGPAPRAQPAERSVSSSTAPPPAGGASANGAGLGLIDSCISCTGAAAGPGSSQSGARGLRVLGLNLAGSDGAGCDSQRGALLSLPVGSLLDLGVADWSCSRRAAGGSSRASSRSALVDLGVDGDQILGLSVLEGRSDATYGSDASHGDGVTNGVDLSLLHGAVAVTVLHTEASSDGTRTVDVAGVNGLRVLGSDRGDGGVPVNVPGVISIDLLRTAASGGIAGAEVGAVSDVLNSNGQSVGLLAATASGGASPATPSRILPDVPPPGTTLDPPTTIVDRPNAGGHAAAPGVPLTGISLGMAGIGLLVSGLAGVSLAAARRRTADTD
jgi:hypothetical protein